MKLEIHVHVHNHESESLVILRKIYEGLKTGEFPMALSPEMEAFVQAASAFNLSASESLANISADVQRLLNASTGLSEEDKAALLAHTESLNALSVALSNQAAVVPEP